jgi:hypothetical protein
MPIVTLPGAAIAAATDFVNSIQLNREIYHLYFGKIDSWDNQLDTPGSEISNLFTEREVRNNMVYLRRVMPGEISMCAQKNEWAQAPEYKVYTQWDDILPNSINDYHVVNSNFQVYKCLDNNNGALSEIEPAGGFFVPITLADGYIWKYMYTIPVAKRKRFNSLDKMPVQTALSETFYSQGTIGAINILDSGTGYPNLPITTLRLDGTTTGSGLDAVITQVNEYGGITQITINDGGGNYTSLNLETSGIGASAVLVPTVVSGVITDITITAMGSNYVIGDTITSSVGGAILLPVIDPVSGSIVSVKVINAGKGYVGAPNVIIEVEPGYSTGTGKYPGNSGAIIVLNMLDGEIDTISINDPGLDYVKDNATSILVVGDGTGAELIPILDSTGAVVEIFIKSGGTGYTFANANISGIGGSGASISINLNDSDIVSDQSIVEQSAIDGAIHNIVLITGGVLYTSQTNITISGDGVGCIAVPVIDQGIITKISIIAPGTGYTRAVVTINDPTRNDPSNTLQFATARAIISPAGGHGRNAVRELRVDSVCISAVLQDIPEFKLISQDFRQYGLTKNIRKFNTNKRLTALSSYEAIITRFENTVDLLPDMVIQNNINFFKVIYIDGKTVHLIPLTRKPVSPIGILRTADSVSSWSCSAILTYPTTDRYTGDLLFVSNEVPFIVDEVQGINIKTYLKF